MKQKYAVTVRQGRGPGNERTFPAIFLLRAYQAIAPWSISFFTRIACGTHGLCNNLTKPQMRSRRLRVTRDLQIALRERD